MPTTATGSQHCASLPTHRNPVPTVDIIISHPGRGIVLVKRRFPPYGWALPGGFVDYGETVENAARREAKEETGIEVLLGDLVGVYSDPSRDARLHTISTVFAARCVDPDTLQSGDDAAEALFFPLNGLPELAFDHGAIVQDYAGRFAAQYGVAPPETPTSDTRTL